MTRRRASYSGASFGRLGCGLSWSAWVFIWLLCHDELRYLPDARDRCLLKRQVAWEDFEPGDVFEHRPGPVKIVVFNNSALAFIELEMKAAGILDFATDLHNPNFAEVAKVIGLFGARVESPEDLGGALKDAFSSNSTVGGISTLQFIEGQV